MTAVTFTDLFCGAGGSSIGGETVGAELRLGLNHWARAIETHAHNFQDADHDCEDVSSLTTAQIRRYPIATSFSPRRSVRITVWRKAPAGVSRRPRACGRTAQAIRTNRTGRGRRLPQGLPQRWPS